MNQISVETRKNIFDSIRIEELYWAGKLEDDDFLSRIFDLSQYPSHDSRFPDASGDIWQHRINNPDDWEDDWIFDDKRFNLLGCDDSIFLQFLCETVHPVIRPNIIESKRLVQSYNDCLHLDGFELIEKMKLANRPVYIGRRKMLGSQVQAKLNREIRKFLDAEYISQQITIMEGAIHSSPYLAIGTAKELIESCCKSILDEHNVEINKSWSLPNLIKETGALLQLTPHSIPDDRKGANTIKKILGSLTSVVNGICELRNDYGSGHGKNVNFKGLGPRHAKLAVGAASTLAVFLLETNEIRKSINKST